MSTNRRILGWIVTIAMVTGLLCYPVSSGQSTYAANDGSTPAGAISEDTGGAINEPNEAANDIGGTVRETETAAANPQAVSETETPEANPQKDSTGAEEALPNSADTLSPQDVSSQATVEEYISLQRFTGTHDVIGAAANASTDSVSSDSGVAKFSNGKIAAGGSGIADVTVPMANGDTAIFHVSVYYEYPQPQQAQIRTGRNNIPLQKYAKYNDNSGNGAELNAGDTIRILRRIEDNQPQVMHYVRSSDGMKEGWIAAEVHNRRGTTALYPELEVGKSMWFSTTVSGTPRENNTWTKTGSDISIKSETHDGYDRQCEITGVRTGTGTVIGTDSYFENGCFVTVYKKADFSGMIKNDTVMYEAADTIPVAGYYAKNDLVTISGESGDYWRVGRGGNSGRYVKKSDVDILVTGITLNKTYAEVSVKNTIQLNATVTPSNASNKTVSWSSGNSTAANVNSGGLVSSSAEGVTTITATTNSNGKTATSKISVYSPIAPSIKGQVYHWAVAAVYQNGDGTSRIGTSFSGGTSITINGQCGNYWRIGANQYVSKNDVRIPATEIKTDKTYAEVPINGQVQLSAKVLPELATNNRVEWENATLYNPNGSADVDVDESGIVKAFDKEQTVSVTVGNANKEASKTFKLTIFSPFKNIKGKTTVDATIWQSADETVAVDTLSKGTPLTISGQSGSYWRIGADRYISKSVVTIPVTKITISKTAKVKKNGFVELSAKVKITPAQATNKAVTWKSSNKKNVTVNKNGKIKGIKPKGKAKITVTAKDGSKKKASCIVTVKGTAGKSTVKATSVKGTYIYPFINSSLDFFGRDENGNVKSGKYYMSAKDKKRLKKDIWRNPDWRKKFTKEKSVARQIRLKSLEAWGGSCFGMSASTLLNKSGAINVRQYTSSAGTSNYLDQVGKPSNNKPLKSLINYYQIGGSLSGIVWSEYYTASNWKDTLMQMVSTSAKNKAQLLNYSYLNSGRSAAHAIIVKGTPKKRGDWYIIPCLDPNGPGTTVWIDGKYTKIKVFYGGNEEYGFVQSIQSIDDLTIFKYLDIDG